MFKSLKKKLPSVIRNPLPKEESIKSRNLDIVDIINTYNPNNNAKVGEAAAASTESQVKFSRMMNFLNKQSRMVNSRLLSEPVRG